VLGIVAPLLVLGCDAAVDPPSQVADPGPGGKGDEAAGTDRSGEDAGVDAGGGASDTGETEPNDDADHANVVQVPASLPAALTPGDTDVFAFDLTTGQAVEVETVVTAAEAGGVAVDTVIELFDPDEGQPFLSDDDSGQNAGSFARFTADRDGRYRVGVRGYNAVIAGPYTLELRATPAAP
jgi:pre-peptidase